VHISLTPKLEEMVRSKVDSGLYNNASEVIRAALRLMANEDKEYEERLKTLRAEIKKGEDSIARGEYTEINSKEELAKLLDEIPDAEDGEAKKLKIFRNKVSVGMEQADRGEFAEGFSIDQLQQELEKKTD